LNRFYEETPEKALRLGDVVRGFQVTTPQVHRPHQDIAHDWTISVSATRYFVVMTPCCSIENKSIVLSPLLSVRPSFLKNEYLASDLTNINRLVPPEKSVPHGVWEGKLSPEEKSRRIKEGKVYVVRDCFVYEQHDLLQKYPLDDKTPTMMGHYMVDFKCICRIECDQINRDSGAPPGIKLLQLTKEARQELRDKLVSYFGRIPEEDEL
jgi:hypothetical protein